MTSKCFRNHVPSEKLTYGKVTRLFVKFYSISYDANSSIAVRGTTANVTVVGEPSLEFTDLGASGTSAVQVYHW